MRGTPRTEGSTGEVISHYNGVRMRVIGQGQLKLTLRSLQGVRVQSLADLPMQMTTNIEPLRLANFMEQRVSLEIKTTALNDYFRINRIILFGKPVFSMYPA